MVHDEVHDSGPCRVQIVMHKDGKDVPLYATEQRNLFKKYADKRAQSIEEIQAAVRKAL